MNNQLRAKLVSAGKQKQKQNKPPLITLHRVISRLQLKTILILHIKMITHDLNLNFNWISRSEFTLQSDTFRSQLQGLAHFISHGENRVFY